MHPSLHRWPNHSLGAAGFDLLLINRVQAVWFPATGPRRVRDGDAAAVQALSASAPHGPAGTCGSSMDGPSQRHPARWGPGRPSPLSWVQGDCSLPPAQSGLPAVLTWSLVWERSRAGWVSPA